MPSFSSIDNKLLTNVNVFRNNFELPLLPPPQKRTSDAHLLFRKVSNETPSLGNILSLNRV